MGQYSADRRSASPSPSPSPCPSSPEARQQSAPPPQRPRWMYARGKGWATFGSEDDEALEERWQALGGADWASSLASKRDSQGQESPEDADRTQGRSRTAPQRPAMPSAPPSGVDAVRSALNNFTDLPDKAKRTVQQTADQASGAMSAKSGSSTPLKKVSQQMHSQDGGGEQNEGEGADRKPASTDIAEGKTVVNEILDPDQPESERTSKVAVMEDKLFDVDLERMVLYPVFWKGVLLKVVRATWFYSSSTDGSYAPIAWDDPLSKDLDAAYQRARPWARHDDETSTDRPGSSPSEEERNTGKSEEKEQDQSEVVDPEKLLPLPSMKDQGQILFESSEVGRIFSQDLRGRFLSVLGGSIVVRGFDKAETIARAKSGGSYLSFSLPWAADDEDESKDGGKGKKQQRQEQGSTFGARAASSREGAAQAGGKPPSGGGADESNPSPSGDDDTDERRSFASRLWPSSDSLTRPGVALLRMLGYSKEDATEEGKRQVKQEATENEVDRQRNADTAQGRGGGEKVEGDAGEGEPEIEEDLKDEPPELVLAVHGIGQQLTEDFDALDFVYDVERLRNVSNKQALDPAVRQMARGRRAQYIPICWRRDLSFDEQPEGNDNFYTLDDVTNSAAIPIVRNVISKVVLDVPFYLSHHRKKMISSVVDELNRTYRLFCRRNPEFETKGGRVSVIGHSLGSALAVDILSEQPTSVPLLCERDEQERRQLQESPHLLFNVKNLFFIGSPVGFFLYLDGGQLIARRGTQRNRCNQQRGEEDATREGPGSYGCLAAEAVYNIYNPTDPVAFQLGPTADRTYASLVRPVPIADAAGAILQALTLPRLSVSRIFERYGDRPFRGVGRIVKQAKRYEESGDDEDTQDHLEQGRVGQDPEQEERRQSRERILGRRIVESSHFLKHVRKMKKLDDEARRKKEQADRAKEDGGDREDQPEPTDETKETTRSVVDEPAPMETEAGTLKKRLQPRRTLDQARRKGLVPSPVDVEDDEPGQDQGEGEPGLSFDLDTLERGERRFRALNPHGCIDFLLSSSIAFSEYLDMIGAHVSYWTHPDFATFVLTQLFADWRDRETVTVVPDVELPITREAKKEDGNAVEKEGEEGDGEEGEKEEEEGMAKGGSDGSDGEEKAQEEG